jgi:hypothetical protein
MRSNVPPNLYHTNRYSADSACTHCGGIVRHERWCAEKNAAVSYAFAVAENVVALSWQDELILHALGVCWEAQQN